MDLDLSARTFNRIGLVGDIHTQDELLEIALNFLVSQNVEIIAATGDIVTGIGSVDRCCKLLQSRSVVTVRGNHDRWFLEGVMKNLPNATPAESVASESRRMLEQLPDIIEFKTPKGRALLCHGLGHNDMAKVGPDDYGYGLETNTDLQNLIKSGRYRWILNGHSHRRMVRHFGNLTVINAGTLKEHQDPCVFILDFRAMSGSLFSIESEGPSTKERMDFSLEEGPTLN
jgi:putative phosphoesterase